jgi:4-hydroxy-tetrahydrodipicolinate reductase
MRIAIIGYGKMGHVIEEISFNRGHSIVCIIDPTAMDAEVSSISGAPIYTPERGFESALFATVEVAIEFSTPATAEQNIANCFAKGVRVVSGTTGWDHAAAKNLYTKAEWGWIWSSNYSLGVNILFALNQRLAQILSNQAQGSSSPLPYSPSICETHHIHKLDKPSGTAKTLAEGIEAYGFTTIPIESIREGEVAGIHTIEWESAEDIICLSHNAKNRRGFALGAVIAAEWLKGKSGFHTMQEVLGV